MPSLRISLSFLASQFGAHAAQLFATSLEPLGLRPQDAGLIRMLSVRGEMTQVDMSETFGVQASRIVVLLDRLEQSRLVMRQRDTVDRRCMRVSLTPAGQATAEKIQRLTLKMEQKLFESLNKDERKAFQVILSKLAEAAELRSGVHPTYREIASGKSDQ